MGASSLLNFLLYRFSLDKVVLGGTLKNIVKSVPQEVADSLRSPSVSLLCGIRAAEVVQDGLVE